MSWRYLGMRLLAAVSLAAQSAHAQKGQSPTDVRKPFRIEESDRDVPRAMPVERPVPRAVPIEKPLPPPVAPDPIAAATPRPAATPAPKPASPPPDPLQPEPDEPGTIRIGQSVAPRSAEQQQLEYADAFYARKLFDQAAPEYEKYLGLYPNGADRATALFRLGESYRRNGSFNAAKNAYETLLTQVQQGDFIGPAAYRLADIYYQGKQYREALPLYRKASVRLKEPAVINAAKFYTGRCLEALGQKLDARTSYEDLVSVVDNNPFQDASRLSLALLLKESGRTSDALKQAQSLAKQTANPELKMEAAVRAGLWLNELEQATKAEAQLKDALTLGGSSKWREVARIGLIKLQYNSGKYEQVISTFKEEGSQFSAEAKPELLLLAANAYRQVSGKGSEARALYEQLLKEYPTSTYAKEAQFERLKLFYYSDDPDLVPEIDKYLLSNPEAAERDQVTLMKAEVTFKKQDYAAALPLYGALTESRTLSGAFKAEALLKQGFCYIQTRDAESGIKAFGTFISQNPVHKSLPYALIQRGLAYQQRKDLASALKDYDALIAKFPKAKERELALQQKGLILGQRGDNAGMAEAFKTLLKDFPNSSAKAQANYWVGRSAFDAKNYKEAIGPLRQARDLDKEQFFEKASFLLLLAAFNLEDEAATAEEIDIYSKEGKEKVPAQILRWVGTERAKQGAFEDAAKYFQLLTPRDEATPDDFLQLGRSQLKLKRFKEATAALNSYLPQVKEPVPRASGFLALGEASLGTRDFDAAEKAADEVLTLQPEGTLNGEGRILSGDVQVGRGNFEDAAKIYRSVGVMLDDEEVTPRALEKAIAAYEKAGNEAEAKKTRNTLQSRYPEYYQRKISKAP